MGQLLFVVSRDAVTRYTDLKRAFSDREAIEVVLDRRRAERRRAASQYAPGRRRRERRARPEIDAELKSIGYSVVRLPAEGRQSAARVETPENGASDNGRRQPALTPAPTSPSAPA